MHVAPVRGKPGRPTGPGQMTQRAGVIQAMADVPVLEAAAAEAAPKRKGKTLLIVIVLSVLLVGGGVGAWFAFAPHGKQKHAEVKKEPPAPALSVALDPPFVVNFEAEQQVRFLQVTAQLMTRDAAIVEMLKANDPVIRNGRRRGGGGRGD